jgi:hypothetical protein
MEIPTHSLLKEEAHFTPLMLITAINLFGDQRGDKKWKRLYKRNWDKRDNHPLKWTAKEVLDGVNDQMNLFHCDCEQRRMLKGIETVQIKPIKRTQDDLSVDCQKFNGANKIIHSRNKIEGLKREKEMMESRIQLLEHEKQRLQERLDRATVRRVLNPNIWGITRKRGQFPR